LINPAISVEFGGRYTRKMVEVTFATEILKVTY